MLIGIILLFKICRSVLCYNRKLFRDKNASILFGSRARGDYKERSDIDIAFRGGNSSYSEAATGSPRAILKTAYRAGMINDENLWLDALVSRNNVAQAYNQAIAMDIVNLTKENYYSMFVNL